MEEAYNHLEGHLEALCVLDRDAADAKVGMVLAKWRELVPKCKGDQSLAFSKMLEFIEDVPYEVPQLRSGILNFLKMNKDQQLSYLDAERLRRDALIRSQRESQQSSLKRDKEVTQDQKKHQADLKTAQAALHRSSVADLLKNMSKSAQSDASTFLSCGACGACGELCRLCDSGNDANPVVICNECFQQYHVECTGTKCSVVPGQFACAECIKDALDDDAADDWTGIKAVEKETRISKFAVSNVSSLPAQVALMLTRFFA